MMRRLLAVSASTMMLCIALAPGAAAQGTSPSAVHDIHRLGGTTAFYKPRLTSTAGLKRMGSDPRVAANVRVVLGQAGMSESADAVVAALSSIDMSVRGGLCKDADPQPGTVVECDVQPGQTMLWMAYRPHGDARLGLFTNVRWTGKASFPAYLIRVTSNNRIHTFIIPKECGNLTLLDERDVPRVAVVEPPPPPPPPPPAAIVVPPPPPPAVIADAPAPPPPPQPAPVVAVVKASPFFVDALFGKDRRVRPIAGRTTLDGNPVIANTGSADFAQCSPLFGVKIGVAKRFENNWEIAGAAGVAISLVNAGHKMREHEVLVDGEVNKYTDGGVLLGTGISFWDITHSDTFTPAWMLHVGLPLGTHPRHPVYFLMEGRLFFDHFGDVMNNYQFWGGVRVHI